jgi:hypothetical protein
MPLDINIRDCKSDVGACVRPNGALIVGAFDYSRPYQATLGIANTPVNLVGPISGKRFIVTDILLYANKSVGVGDATVTLYESQDGPASATQSSVILNTEMLKNSSRDLVGLNMLCSAGHWLNAVTDDDDVFLTIMGYYVDDVLEDLEIN